MIGTLNEHVGIELRGFFFVGCENTTADAHIGITDSREHGRTPIIIVPIHIAEDVCGNAVVIPIIPAKRRPVLGYRQIRIVGIIRDNTLIYGIFGVLPCYIGLHQ